jgi:hypothetical protein
MSENTAFQVKAIKKKLNICMETFVVKTYKVYVQDDGDFLIYSDSESSLRQ